jgi:hypothetical protein
MLVTRLVVAVLVLTTSGAYAQEQITDDMPGALPEDPKLPPEPPSDTPPLRFEVNAFGAGALRLPEDSGKFSFGFGFTYGMGWGSFPITLGLSFIELNTNQHHDNTLLQQDGSEGVFARRQSKQRVMHFDLWLRVQPPYWAVRPYVEGHIGAQLVQTQYGVDIGAGDTAASSAVVNDQDWSSSYGWGAGVDFWGLFNASRTISLTLGVRQLFGETAHFRRELPIGGNSYVTDSSYVTRALIVMVGLITVFDLSAEPDPYERRRFTGL